MPGGPVLAIGGGEGSAQVARRVLKSLPSDSPAGVLLYLTPAAGGEGFDPVRFLQPRSGLPVATAKDGAPVPRGMYSWFLSAAALSSAGRGG